MLKIKTEDHDKDSISEHLEHLTNGINNIVTVAKEIMICQHHDPVDLNPNVLQLEAVIISGGITIIQLVIVEL